MRLLLVVDVFTPVRTSAAVQMHDLAIALSAAGHECTLVTPDAGVPELFSLESCDGFPVIRIKSPPLKHINLVRRAINELALSRRMWRGFCASPAAARPYDGIVFYSPTIFFGKFIARLKARYRCPAYLILRDVFPDWAAQVGVMRKGPHYWFFKRTARYQYGVADTIGIESEANRRYFLHSDHHVEILDNWIDLANCAARPATLPAELHDKKILIYAGNIGVAQDINNLLRLASRLAKEVEDARLLIVGNGTELARTRQVVSREGLCNVVFQKEISPQELRGLLRLCHVGVMSLDKRLMSHNIPGKLLSYLEAGLPVLGSVNPGNEVKYAVEEAGAGMVVWNGDDEALASAAIRLLNDAALRKGMGASARALCARRFSSHAAASKIVSALSHPKVAGRFKASAESMETGAHDAAFE